MLPDLQPLTGPSPSILVAALYRFAPVPDPGALRDRLEQACGHAVRGTLLVAFEGINGTIAGAPEAIQRVLDILRAEPGLADPELKFSHSETMPFHRLKVCVKPEIVTLGLPDLDPAAKAGTYVAPEDWNALISDPDTIVIDTRNRYEGDVGAFAGAIQPGTVSFRDFPDWFRTEGRALLDRPVPPKVAMYCTGGIRCEKATAFLRAEGVAEVFHLQGGILRYLETVPEPESLWQGECFVFDERVAVGHGLEGGTHTLCRGCRMPVSPSGRASPHYIEGVCCDRCHESRSDRQREAALERDRQVRIAGQRGMAHIGPRRGGD